MLPRWRPGRSSWQRRVGGAGPSAGRREAVFRCWVGRACAAARGVWRMRRTWDAAFVRPNAPGKRFAHFRSILPPALLPRSLQWERWLRTW